MTKKNAPNNVVLQFRTGEWVGGRILDLAAAWKVTPHEAGRRLMMLAMFRLTLDHYPVIERLADAVGGGNNFLRACDMALAALRADELTRKETGRKPRTEQERVAYLERWAQDFTSGRQALPGVPRDAAPEDASRRPAQEHPSASQSGGKDRPRRIRLNLEGD